MSAYTTLYPGDATEGLKPTFIVAQTRLIKFSRSAPTSRPHLYPKNDRGSSESVQSGAAFHQQMVSPEQGEGDQSVTSSTSNPRFRNTDGSAATYSGQNSLLLGHQDASLASEHNLFDELKTTKSSSWQYEIRQLEKRNRMLAEEVQSLLAAKKKRKRRRGKDQQKDCANCHTRVTPEWRRGPSGLRDLCNSCGLRWAKLVSVIFSKGQRSNELTGKTQNGRVSPRTSSVHSAGASDKASKASASPRQVSSQTVVKTELVEHAQGPSSTVATPGIESKESHSASRPTEGHAAQMQGASGIPDKIEEDAEEPD